MCWYGRETDASADSQEQSPPALCIRFDGQSQPEPSNMLQFSLYMTCGQQTEGGTYLGGEVPDHIGQVSSPEGGDSLLSSHTGEAVANASVPRYLSTLDARVRVLHQPMRLQSSSTATGSLLAGQVLHGCAQAKHHHQGQGPKNVIHMEHPGCHVAIATAGQT